MPKLQKAAVIIPPLKDFYFTRHRFSALGAHIVTNILERSGIPVDLFNFPLLKPKGTTTVLPADLNYLKPFLMEGETGKLSFFTRFRHFGPSIEECAEQVLGAKPDVCFFSVFAFCYADTAIELAREIKKREPGIWIVAGGSGVCCHPDYFLKDRSIDFAVSGEAEQCLQPFINAFALSPAPLPHDFADNPAALEIFAKVPHLHWRGHANLAPLPTSASVPEFALVKTEESSKSVTFATILSRGCPKQCDFCSSKLTFGNIFRTVPLERIEQTLARFSDDTRDKQLVINIEDDNFLIDRAYLENAVAIFKRAFPDIRFIAENGIDHSFLTPETCALLQKLGFSKFNLSLASINRKILDNSRRFLSIDGYEQAIGFLSREKIPSVTYFICGFAEDTVETTLYNLNYLFKQQTVTGISLFYAVPGMPGFTDTSLFEKKSSTLCCGSAAFPWNKSLSTKTMVTAFRLSRLSNLLKENPFPEAEKEVVRRILSTKRLYTRVKSGKGREAIVAVIGMDDELVERFVTGLSASSEETIERLLE